MSNDTRTDKKISAGEIVVIIITAILVILAAVYILAAALFKNRFYPYTYVNGTDMGFKRVDEAQEILLQSAPMYGITLTDDKGNDVELSQSALGVIMSYEDSLYSIIGAQSYKQWITQIADRREHYLEPVYYCNREILGNTVAGLECVTRSDSKRPEDAQIVYLLGAGYIAAHGKRGDLIDADALTSYIASCVIKGQPTVDIRDVDVYVRPDITVDNEELKARVQELNDATKGSVTYTLRGEKVTVDADVYHDWIEEKDGRLKVNESMALEYVTNLADKYDTFGKQLTFKNSWGVEVSVKRAESGWQTDIEAETAQLVRDLESGKQIERDIISTNTAASHGVMDFGDSYIEVNLTRQHLMLYKDGELLLETDIVSGRTTPTGLYEVYRKQTSRVLRGDGYASYVDFWMPFHGAYGLHDASWRSEFGGEIYKNHGSHGCVNMPCDIADDVYNAIDIGFPVVLYYEP